MPDFAHLFIHPLIGADDAWRGFVIESANTGPIPAEWLAAAMKTEAFAGFDQRLHWFGPLTEPLPAAQYIPIFLANPAPASNIDGLKAQEAVLRQKGHKLAQKAALSQKLASTGTWDYLLIAASHARTLPAYSMTGLSTRTGIIVTDVHSHADRDWAFSNDGLMVTTEYLLNRHPPGKKADLTRLKLLELLSLLAADADTTNLEEVFRQEPKLAYSLLRLVNSAANAPREPINSFAQAINILGRRQLERWLQLLVFADQNNGQQANPLLQKAATRGRLMELLVSQEQAADQPLLDAAFMVGTFSLLDVLLNMSIKEILQHLQLPEIVAAALADHSGPLGELLNIISASESRDLSGASERLVKCAITAEGHLDAQIKALSWASGIQRN